MTTRIKENYSAGRKRGGCRSPLVLSLAALTMLLAAPTAASAQLDLLGGGGGGGAGESSSNSTDGGAGGSGGMGGGAETPGTGGAAPNTAGGGAAGTSGGGGAAGDNTISRAGGAAGAVYVDDSAAGGTGGRTPPATQATAEHGRHADSITYTLNRDVTYSDDLNIIAGSGGDGGWAATNSNGTGAIIGNGGDGGDVTLSGLRRTVTVDGTGASPITFTVKSGAGGADNDGTGGAGGDVSVTLQTLKTSGTVTIDLIRGNSMADGGGQVDFSLADLRVNGGIVTMNFGSNGGTALQGADEVQFNTLRLINTGAGAATFSTDGNWIGNASVGTNAGYNFDHLYVSGIGNQYFTDTGTAVGSATQYAPGAAGQITFDAVNTAGGDTMLSATSGAADRSGGAYGTAYTDGIDFTDVQASNLHVRTTYHDAVSQSDSANKVIFIDGVVDGRDDNSWTVGNAATVWGQYGSLGVVEYLTDFDARSGGDTGLLNGYARTIYDDAYAINLQAGTAALMTARDGYRTVFTTLRNFVETEESNKVLLKAAIDGGSFRNKADGGHIEDDTFNFNLGLGYLGQTGLGRTTIGAFFEAGSGSYEAAQNTRFYGDLTGDGQTEHYGGGLMFHNEFANRLYIELSGRAGRLDNQFGLRYTSRLNNFPAPIGGGVSFGTDQAYYGSHFGLGYKYDLTDLCELDVYGKFLWTRLDSTDFRNQAGEYFQMDAADSLRSQLGFRVTQQYMENENGGYDLKGYVGAAWEHEFDGQSGGRVDGRRIVSPHGEPELQGSSVLGEAGLIIQPAGAGYAVDLGVFGSGGQQRGLGGTAALKFEF